MQLDVLHRDENVELKGDKNLLEQADKVVLSFTGIGQNVGKMREQAPEFVGTASRQGGLIVVTDLWRSWGNHVDWEKVREIIEPYVDGRRLFSIGNSMGGFLSILSTSFWPIERAIAFAPQFSVHPEVLPSERRWSALQKGILNWRYPSLAAHIHPDRAYHLFFGEFEPDMLQARCFPGVPNLHRYIVPEAKHGVAGHLKRVDALQDIVGQCVEGGFSLEAVRDRIGRAPYEMRQDEPAAAVGVPSGTMKTIEGEALQESLREHRDRLDAKRDKREARKASLTRADREARWAERFVRSGGSEEEARATLEARHADRKGDTADREARRERRAARRASMSEADLDALRAKRRARAGGRTDRTAS